MNKFHGGVKASKLDVSIPVILRDSTTSALKTGIAYGSITVRYWRQGGSVTTVTPSALGSLAAEHTDGGWYEVDGSNMPGLYRLDLPDAAIAVAGGAGLGDWVVVSVTASGTLGYVERFILDSANGFAELWGEVASGTYGLSHLVRSSTPANPLSVDSSGRGAADVQAWQGSAPAGLSSTYVQSIPASLSTQAKADVNAECDTALETAISELTAGAPTATPTIKQALMLLYMAMRNKCTNDGYYLKIHDDAGTEIAKAQVSESAGAFTRSEMESP